MTGSTDIHAVVDFYAKRGLLRNVRTTLSEGRATRVQFTWHYDRTFDLRVDYEASRLSFTDAFPNVPAASALYRDLSGFIDGMMSDSAPVRYVMNDGVVTITIDRPARTRRGGSG